MSDLPHVDPGQPDLTSPNRFLRWVALAQKRILIQLIFWGIVWMGAQAVIPAALGAGVQSAADGDLGGVRTWALAVLGLGLVQALAGIMRHRRAVWNWISAATRVQQLVTGQAVHLGADLSQQVATGEVVAVTSSDVERIGSAFDVLGRFVGAVVAFIGVGIVLIFASPLLGTIVLIGIPLLTLGISPLLRPLEQRERAQREKLGRATELAADTVAGLRVLRGIGGEQMFLERFQVASQEVRSAAVHTARIRSTLDALQVALPGIFLVFVTWLGARLVLDGTLAIGELVAFYGYAAFLVLPLRTVTETAHKYTRARVAAGRIITVMSLERSRPEPLADREFADFAALSVSDLHDDVTGLLVPGGQFTAVVSDDPEISGALTVRLAGLSAIDEPGEAVRLGATRLVDLPTATVRSLIVLQDKDPVILSGTFEQALSVPRGADATAPRDRDGLLHALDSAAAQDVVEAVEYGDDLATDVWGARITERGRSLSGGQRQRLALARSLATDAPILILDEPTSAVDTHTEARIAGALGAERVGLTTVVITASPLLLDVADHVALIVDGSVVASGRHRDLLRDNDSYRSIVLRGES